MHVPLATTLKRTVVKLVQRVAGRFGFAVVRLHREFRPELVQATRFTVTDSDPPHLDWLILPLARTGSLALQQSLASLDVVKLIARERADQILFSKNPRGQLCDALREIGAPAKAETKNALLTHDTSVLFRNPPALDALCHSHPQLVSLFFRNPLQLAVSSYNHLLYSLTTTGLHSFGGNWLPWPTWDRPLTGGSIFVARALDSHPLRFSQIAQRHPHLFLQDRKFSSATDFDRLIHESFIGSVIDVFPFETLFDERLFSEFLSPMVESSLAAAQELVRFEPSNDTLARFLNANSLWVKVANARVRIDIRDTISLRRRRAGELRVQLSIPPQTIACLIGGRNICRQVAFTVDLLQDPPPQPLDIRAVDDVIRANASHLLDQLVHNIALTEMMIAPHRATDINQILDKHTITKLKSEVIELLDKYPSRFECWEKSL